MRLAAVGERRFLHERAAAGRHRFGRLDVGVGAQRGGPGELEQHVAEGAVGAGSAAQRVRSAVVGVDAEHARGEAPQAARALRPTAESCLALGVVDVVVPEPSGGAHRDKGKAAELLGRTIEAELQVLAAIPPSERRVLRRERLRRLGAYVE